MYQLVDESDYFNEGNELNFEDYARANGISSIANLEENEREELQQAHLKYIQDRGAVEALRDKYFTRDALGRFEIQKDQYTVRRIHLIMKQDIKNLDHIATQGIYKDLSKALAARMAMDSVNHILEVNKNLTTEEKLELFFQ